MKWNKQFEYPKSMRSLINDERHYEVGSEKLPSVTTILSATASDEKRESPVKKKATTGKKPVAKKAPTKKAPVKKKK